MNTTVYLVYLETDRPARIADAFEVFELVPGLFLIETRQTRSQLYHAVKRRFAPERLLVAPLSDAPKFKGMAAGAVKWLRRRGER